MPPLGTHKSRNGCRNCKNRHIKCDETTPSCINCTTTHRHCSYLSLVAQTTALHKHQPPRARLGHTRISPITTAIASLPRQQQTFTVQDIALLHHFGDGLSECMLSYHPSAPILLKLASKHALEAPYLLNQLLAISAAHLSSRKSDSQSYRRDATIWQTRALHCFNTVDSNADTGQDWVSTIFFSVFLSHQAFFEPSSTRHDFLTFLAFFVRCLGLYRGIHAITSGYWPSVEPHLLPHLDTTFVRAIGVFRAQDFEDGSQISDSESGSECRDLFKLLGTIDAESSLYSVLRQAVESLRKVLDISRSDPSQHVRAILSWMVLLTEDFAKLLEKQQLEALVVLAHYACALDSISEYWVVHDTGQYIVRSVVRNLDDKWHVWLTWPIQKFAETGNVV